MPLYDFECPHGHRFERQCKIAERKDLVPCEGIVSQLISDDEVEKAESGELEGATEMFGGAEGDESFWVREVSCILKAKCLIGTHSHPQALLDHGMAANRDAAREGRYDPLNPNRRFMAKGRGWRK